MKIIFVHTFYKVPGGEDTVVQNEMELLRRNGHQVDLVEFKNEGNTFAKILFSPFNFFSYLIIKEKIKSIRPDLIHIHNLHFAASASVIHGAHKMGVPIVATLHNYRFLCPSGTLYFDGELFLDSLKTKVPWKAIKLGVYRNSRLLTFLLGASNYIQHKIKTFDKISKFIVLGEHSKSLFLNSHFKNYHQKFVVKPNFSPSTSTAVVEEGSYFLFVGRLSKEKGVETLLEAFSATSIKLRIIGSGEFSDEIISRCSIHKNITYLGQQPQHVVKEQLNGALALVFPSQWYETFGMVLIEAYSRSVPVIASDLGNIKTIVEDGKTGLTFEPGNAQDLLKKVTYYNNLPTTIKAEYRCNARKAYEKANTPEINYNLLIAIYKDAISNHSSQL
ncbi:glycosyltransferase family 4 protein [Pedobacter sp. MC2016-05]|uniref:glycosyltransferase family 4 protein n=1 Tax=Pedobacter sp. MC2016-05 TaxID=2994474 RepID=UPI00224859EE|nr:glycosyltransferase family 4 protein [Pedobacter sp. MC2016-05]MCX2473265.1 glycosyltransferase family 4 protein [Pedobacter sp. MC2016-05]